MKACFFDIDGTLVQTGGAGQWAFAETFLDLFGIEELSKEVPFAGRSDRGIAGGFFRAHGLDDSQANWDRFRDGYVERLGRHVRERDGGLLPGVPALIDRVEALGDVDIGLLTGNIRRAAEVKLGHYGLWDRFEFGGFGDDHPDRNDIAAAALAAARRRRRERSAAERDVEEKIVVIGDTPNDVRCARAIGAWAVAVPTGPTPVEDLIAAQPDLLVETLEQADAVVEYLVG